MIQQGRGLETSSHFFLDRTRTQIQMAEISVLTSMYLDHYVSSLLLCYLGSPFGFKQPDWFTSVDTVTMSDDPYHFRPSSVFGSNHFDVYILSFKKRNEKNDLLRKRSKHRNYNVLILQ